LCGGEERWDRHHFEYPDVNGRWILRWTFRKWNGGRDMD